MTAPHEKHTSGQAIASLILGILSILGASLFLVPPILAIILGHVAVAKCANNRNLRGRGLGIAGFVMGYVGIGFVMMLLPAAAIPAFQKVRLASQDKAILNNARQMAAAADQYFLEYGVRTTASTNLIGANAYVKALNTVAGETYPTYYTQGTTITITGVAGSRTITYAP